MDGMFGEIPVIACSQTYLFNPTYLITHARGPKAGQLASAGRQETVGFVSRFLARTA